MVRIWRTISGDHEATNNKLVNNIPGGKICTPRSNTKSGMQPFWYTAWDTRYSDIIHLNRLMCQTDYGPDPPSPEDFLHVVDIPSISERIIGKRAIERRRRWHVTSGTISVLKSILEERQFCGWIACGKVLLVAWIARKVRWDGRWCLLGQF